MAHAGHPPCRNRLLRALPAAERDVLLALLEPVDLPLRRVLHAAGEPISHAYFVEGGVVSHVVPLEGGHAVEVGLVGPEGMVGLALALGGEASPTEAMVQVPDRALRLPAAALRDAMAGGGALPGLLLRQVLALHAQVARTAACNARHPLEGRLARWLLMVHDRVTGDGLPLTHEFIAMMLGVRRPGVGTALAMLEHSGAIAGHRGHVVVLDRARLEEASCECYPALRHALAALLPG